MPKIQSICQFVSRHRFVRSVAGPVVVFATLALMFLGSSLFTTANSAFAATACKDSTTTNYKLADTGSTYANEHIICLPMKTVPVQPASTVLLSHDHVAIAPSGIKGTYNNFPYGQCTWWANQRYHQLTGVYVPWTTNSDANTWVTRANQYHWKVSTQPKVGSIMMLTPGVQGAFSDGHVAIVEKLLGGGRFQVSQMNWNGGVGIVSHTNFTAARGVYFISIN